MTDQAAQTSATGQTPIRPAFAKATAGGQDFVGQGRRYVTFMALAAALCVLTVVSLLWFRLASLFTVDAVTIEGRAPGLVSPHHVINLFDGRIVTQSFRAAASRVTHVGIGISNLRSASGDATLALHLEQENGTPLATRDVPLRSLRRDRVSRVPLPAKLQKGEPYRLWVTTRGVETTQALVIWYEPSGKHFQDGHVEIQHADGATEQLRGNIRFEIVRLPTAAALVDALRRLFVVPLLGLATAVGGLLLFPSVRQWLGNSLARPLDLPVHPIRRWEILTTGGVGMLLAGIMTIPLYTSLDKIATYVDPNRALVYHAVARDALLGDGEVAQWDPYLCGGVPLLGNPESTHVNPFFLLVLLFGEDVGLRVSVTVSLALGFLGTAVLARRMLGVSLLPMLFAGTVFAFSGFLSWWLSSGAYALFTMAWIPWFLFGFWESLRRTAWIPLSAILLALLFLGGWPHTFVYALIAAGILALWLTVLFRHPRPAIALALTMLLAIPLTAIKLLPVAEVQALSASFERAPARALPLSFASKMFLARDQYRQPAWAHGEENGKPFDWQEYETYTGILPVASALAGVLIALRRRSSLALLGTGGTLFFMTFGYFPWTVLHRLPLMNEILRSPARFRHLVTLFLALFAAAGVAFLLRHIRLPAIRVLVGLTLLGAAGADLLIVHQPVFRRTYTHADPGLARRETFTRVRDSHTNEQTNHYRVGYLNYRANEGTTDLCMPHTTARGTFARGIDSSNPKEPYQGEAFLEQGGEARLVSLRPNHITVSVRPEREGWLVLNQNFFPGWRTTPVREIGERHGRLAVRVSPDDRELRVSYQSLSYRTGRFLTLAALALVVAWLWSDRRTMTGTSAENGLTKAKSV